MDEEDDDGMVLRDLTATADDAAETDGKDALMEKLIGDPIFFVSL